MESICFVMKIKPDKINDYINIHRKGNVWQEILENHKRAGVNKLKIYMLENNAIAYMESEDIEKSFEILGKQESQKKWNEVTAGFMDTQPNYDSNKVVQDLPCIFNYENGKQI